MSKEAEMMKRLDEVLRGKIGRPRYIDVAPYEDGRIVLNREDAGIPVAEISTADVVKVVYCKECKYYQPAGKWRGLCNNRQWYEEIKPVVLDTDFCCYAIRKGGKK